MIKSKFYILGRSDFGTAENKGTMTFTFSCYAEDEKKARKMFWEKYPWQRRYHIDHVYTL